MMKKATMAMPAGTECRNAAIDATTAPRVAPTSGMRSAIATNRAISAANCTGRRVGQEAADGADQQVAGDVAGDGLGAVVGDPADPFAPLRLVSSWPVLVVLVVVLAVVRRA